jgi:exosortase J
MFSPDFGMFIAPGCDGIRGAVTLGYLALILGYVKRASLRRWAAYVIGGVLLGYIFNFIRLCFLVIYYRIALGHPALEGVAKQADYAIGSCLFLLAILIFLRLASLKAANSAPARLEEADEEPRTRIENPASRTKGLFVKCAAFAVAVLAVLALRSSALRSRQSAPASTLPSTASLARFPKQIGGYALTRTWYEQSGGQTLVESGAYSAPGSDEIILAVWVAPFVYYHDANSCWLARGLQPERVASLPYVTAQGNSLDLSTGYYNDGVTDSIVVSVACTPGSCSQSQQVASKGHFSFFILKPLVSELAGGGAHPVPIMIRIDRPQPDRLQSDSPQSDRIHTNDPTAATQAALTAEAQRFLSGLDPMNLSQAFQ